MKASQIYNTKQASNSQQVLLYSNRSPAIIVLVRESRTKPPKRERERTTTSRSSKSKDGEEAEEAQQTAALQCALVLPRSETKFPTFFIEDPNVLSRRSQRSFSKFPTFFLGIPRFVLHARRLCSFAWLLLCQCVPSLFPPHVLSRSSQHSFKTFRPALFSMDDRNVLSGRSPSFSVRVDLNSLLRSLYVPPEFPSSGSL
jgi:hypothetical protein